MSILIKGMEMPTRCESCPCKTADAFGGLGCRATGYIPLRKANQDRPDWCPLVLVPKHGRLIDADALFEKIPSGDIEHDTRISRCGAIADVCTWVLSAPTIIEAEGE